MSRSPSIASNESSGVTIVQSQVIQAPRPAFLSAEGTKEQLGFHMEERGFRILCRTLKVAFTITPSGAAIAPLDDLIAAVKQHGIPTKLATTKPANDGQDERRAKLAKAGVKLGGDR